MDARTRADVVQRRLRALRLVGPPCRTPEDVVGWLGAVQAQDVEPAKWSIGRRSARATGSQVERAYDAGAILRTHVLRPTWHFVLPADIRMLLAATAPRVLARGAHRYRELGLDGRTLEHGLDVVGTALSGGAALTRRELREALTAAGVDVEGQRLPHLLMYAELNGLVCSGPRSGSQHTYALLDERAPGAREVPREDALGDLATRYFTSHGPATTKDFATWASLTLAEARLGLEAAGSALVRERAGEMTLWSAPAPAAPPPASPTVHLIQGYDEYIMGYSETKSLLARPGSSWSPATPPVFALVVLLDGFVAGFWRRAIARDLVTVEVAPLEPLDPAAARALEDEASRYGDFLGLPVRVEYTPGGVKTRR